ncbi:hypothetical protein [Synechocystis sp. LKSZ1]|uniref:hypothetical protein n=1 Tax=Synechocystis sp. LKSZ1 TaxID=3144951 RepID=UPI00336BEB76
MKQLKSRSHDLRTLFEREITAEYIAEPLQTLPAELAIVEGLVRMEQKDFDVMGVEHQGLITGYLERGVLITPGLTTCQDYQTVFKLQDLVSAGTPLIKLLPIFKQTHRLFVLEGNVVTSIITQGDLQKAPVRMLLFSQVTLLEMNLLRLIRLYYPGDSWQSVLKSDRVELAQRHLQGSQARNEVISLLDYLQFCDKRDLVLRHPDLFKKLKFPSRNAGEYLFKSAEKLRNCLAHAQDLVHDSTWSELITLAEGIESLLIRCEAIGS